MFSISINGSNVFVKWNVRSIFDAEKRRIRINLRQIRYDINPKIIIISQWKIETGLLTTRVNLFVYVCSIEILIKTLKVYF